MVSKIIKPFTHIVNLSLKSGIMPDICKIAMVTPIYKTGDKEDPGNYRPISILPILGKTIEFFVNQQLTNYIENNSILSEIQAGFRKNYSVSDHMFTLYSLISYLRCRKKKLFCTFIDFSKAFDQVWRSGLWFKILQAGISGKCFNVIFNMYKNIKSCVKYNGQCSESFFCLSGVRQGENLSPLLFSLFLNDLDTFLQSQDCNGVNIDDEASADLLKLLVLLYADDTVIFAENASDMQRSLTAFEKYCTEWKLSVNTYKTKVVIFGSKGRRLPKFKIFDNEIDITDGYKYLGLYFSKNCTFYKTKKMIKEQATKAMYLLKSRIRNLDLPIDIQLKLFDQTITPILLYGSEVWGFEDCSIIESVHLSFLRDILKVKRSTPLYMIYGELGRFPLILYIKVRVLQFWGRILNGKNTKLSRVMYNILHNDYTSGFHRHKLLAFIENILNETGYGHIWLSQHNEYNNYLGPVILQRLKDQYFQVWRENVYHSSKSLAYRIFKDNFRLEPYLLTLNKNYRSLFTRYRTTNHR